MKNQYLYQGWAGNTYSHKCKNTNENTASTIEYLDISGLDPLSKPSLLVMSFLGKIPELKAIIPMGAILGESPDSLAGVTEVAILLQEKCVNLDHDIPLSSIELFLTKAGVDLNTIPRITKEEFYNLET